jgi:beta-aspartyl-peptidase (threonine type)
MPDAIVAVHGGAGGLSRAGLGGRLEERMREGLRAALRAGQRALASGGGALDAVVAAVRDLEANELWNAGRGSVLAADGSIQMDASVMDGRTRAAGAVAGVRRIVHPVWAARLVMERTPHVLLVGGHAERLAASWGLELADREHFATPRREAQLRQARGPGVDSDGGAARDGVGTTRRADPEGGTVGAVALDRAGHLAAATSTGGMTGQAPGRVGDSPIAGAGTWADDDVCAVSSTGEGELIVRSCMAHEIDAAMRHGGRALGDACEQALARVATLGGRAGCIALSRRGEAWSAFHTAGMPRGIVRANAEPAVSLFADEPQIQAL